MCCLLRGAVRRGLDEHARLDGSLGLALRLPFSNRREPITSTGSMNKRYRCIVCNHVYDPAEGDPDNGIKPGTPFEALPSDWSCPDCGATKEDFEAMSD
jgi:rubredoxin